MELWCIHISPSSGTGYEYSVIAENPKHSLAVLSKSLRLRIKSLQSIKERTIDSYDLHRAIDCLKTIRKPYRYTKSTFGHLWRKVTVTKAIGGVLQTSYTTSMLVYDRSYKENACNLPNKLQ